MKRAIFLVMICCLSVFFATNFAQAKFGVQLPFLDGRAYECTQNSQDTPTHNGLYTKYDLDFALSQGTLVVASAGGVVEKIERGCVVGNKCGEAHPEDKRCYCGGQFGNHVKIKHDNSHSTLYAHLQHNGVIVNVGEHVIAGQPIGFSGNTGHSGGAHLHFGMHEPGRDSIGKSIDDIEIWSRDRNTRQDIWRLVGIPRSNDRAFHCRLNNGTRGHYYEALDINGFDFSPFQCASLSGNAIHCWRGEPDNTGRYHMAQCDNANYHVKYYKNSSGYHAQELSTTNGRDLCNSHTGSADMLAYLFGNGYGGGSSTGGAWHSGGPYPDDPIYDNDPFVPNADVSIRYLRIKGPGQSHYHTESGAVFSPGQTQSVDLKGKIKNESNDNMDMARIQYCATTKKKFRHDERIWIDEDYLDHQEREHDFDPGESITKHGQASITLATDLSSITVFKGNRSHTFPITEKHLYEKKIPELNLNRKEEYGRMEIPVRRCGFHTISTLREGICI